MVNKVFNMDCLEGMQMIPDKSIDMILCDLPYGTTACKWDVIIPFEPLWKQYERIIKDNGAIVLTASQPFTTVLISSNLKLFRYELSWCKIYCTGFMNADKMPMKAHENITIFYKSQPTYNPQIIERTAEELKRRDKTNKVYEIKTESYLNHKQAHFKGREDRKLKYPNSIIKIASREPVASKRGQHPTQKPVALFEYLIKTYTNEGETVLDNCAGSGTTMISCINTNRNYIGFEWSPVAPHDKYFNIIRERIIKHERQEQKQVQKNNGELWGLQQF